MSAPGKAEVDNPVPGGIRQTARRLAGGHVLIPLAVIVLATIVLATSATIIHYRTEALRRETTSLIIPADLAAQDLIVAMALETESLYEYSYYGISAAQLEYERNAAARQFAAQRLVPISEDLEGEPAQHASILLGLVAVWDTMSANAMAAARLGGSGAAIPPDLDALFRRILLEATAVQRALSLDYERARAAIDSDEQLDWYLTLGLVVLSLIASALIIILVGRIRRLGEISERRRIESEALMEERARLIRGITHDVKNPLGAADGSAQLLEMGVVGDLSSRQLEAVRRIRRGIGSALGIIADLIDLSRAESGRLDLVLAPSDLTLAVREVVEEYRHQAEAKAIELVLSMPDRFEPVIADERKIREIVANLLSNSIKYTPKGGRIAIRMEHEVGGPGEPGTVRIAISDTGPGIPNNEQALVFEEYYRSISAVGRAPGAGLGLAISRRMARLMGGDVTLESVPGEGSTFTLSIPVRAAGGMSSAA